MNRQVRLDSVFEKTEISRQGKAVVRFKLVAAGRYDGIAPVANSEALVSRIPKASLQVFEGGHLFLLQDRGAWSAILRFLGA